MQVPVFLFNQVNACTLNKFFPLKNLTKIADWSDYKAQLAGEEIGLSVILMNNLLLILLEEFPNSCQWGRHYLYSKGPGTSDYEHQRV